MAFRRDLRRSTIWRLDLQTREAIPLIEASGRNHDPTYSPDGKRVLFRSSRGPSGAWLANADGSQPTLVAEGGTDARWSPNGRQIVFRALEPGNPAVFGAQNIWVIPAEGGLAKNLTKNSTYQSAPKWSRDGKWIYFLWHHGDEDQGLRRIPSGGGEPEIILNGLVSDPTESHDGQWLYVSMKGGVSRIGPEGEIETVVKKKSGWSGYYLAEDGIYYQIFDPRTGSEIRFHRFEDRSTSVIYRPSGLVGDSIDLSPDGRYLLFVQRESEQSDLMLLDGIH